jgi:RNA polymerase sigma-70 factor (ECF subfamily)
MNGTREEDYDLVRQCQAGNKKACEELVIKYQEKVFKRCYFLLKRNKEEGEDAAQEVFIKAYRNIKNFKGSSKFSTWLYTIAKNHCLNLLKTKNISPIVVDQDGYLTQSYLSGKDYLDPSTVDEECVKQKVNSLKTKYRSVIEKVHFDELTYEEAADRLGCPVGTIRSRLNRAMEKLKPLLRECIE